jgi:hypothetical protein
MSSFVVPATVAPAGYTVTVSDGVHSANGWFVVEPAETPPTGRPSLAIDSDIARPGDRVGIAGSGWVLCRLGDVTVRIGTDTILTVTPDEGWFKEQFVVPSLPDGKYEVIATDACGNAASAMLVVNPGFRLPVP